MTEGTIWALVLDAPSQAHDIGGRMLPPRLSYLPELLWPVWDTLNIATLGTLIGVCLAVPVAFMAARNTTPSAYIARPVALFIIVTSRSINSLIWALLLVAIIGPGVLAGIVAIGLRSIGFVAKLLYEAIEEIDEAQVEAVTATGASGWQVMDYAVVPQVLPAFAGISVFRWDINIRESTILGLVGAGGIGLELQASLAGLAAGGHDHPGHPRHGGRQRVGLGQGPPRHHLTGWKPQRIARMPRKAMTRIRRPHGLRTRARADSARPSVGPPTA